MQTKLLYWKSKFIEVWSNGIFRVITICNLAFSFHEGAWKETEKIPWVFIFTFIFIFSETEDIVTLYNDKMMKIMQMLARAYVQALAFSFFFSEQGHTYENIWAWIWGFIATWTKGKRMNKLPKIYNRSDFI